MALIDLKSDLSWYGKNPPGFKPNADRTQTDFQYNDDLTVTAFPAGYSPLGDAVSFPPRTSLDGLTLDNGSATRKAQLGEGTRFPIGPEGQVHQFDIKRTGWYIGRPYSAIYSNKVPFGLAASYTNNSPIDDMYNKFKVRDEAYDPFGYAKPPFILRGIQQDGESDPQRWGLAGTALANASMEVPRGGIVANVERAALDAVRLGKFLIRPQGLLFIAKQQLLHLMNPNIEDVTGFAVPGPQKLFNPVNFLASAIGGTAGLRFKRWGASPVGDAGKYEFIHTTRNAAGTGILFNRLNQLNEQRLNVANITPSWLPISAPLGPDSVGGIGATTFSKRSSYDTYLQDYYGDRLYPGPITEFIYRTDMPYIPSNGNIIDELDRREGNDTDTALSKYMFILDPTRWTKRSLFSRRNGISPVSSDINASDPTLGQYSKTGIVAQLNFHGQTLNTTNFYGRNYQNIGKIGFNQYGQESGTDRIYIGSQNTETGFISGDTIIGTQDPDDTESMLVSFNTAKVPDAHNLRETVDIENRARDKFWGGVARTVDQKIVENRTAQDNIRNYRSLTYGDIKRLTGGTTPRGPQNGQLIDFRTGQNWSTSDEYRKNTLENYYGYTPYNAANRKRAKPDPINNSRYGDELSSVKDLIKFRFESVGFSGTNGKAIIFRAYINNLSDTFSPSWTGNQDQGRADPKVLYSSFGREISVDFKVVVHSADEQHNVWDKLSALARNTYPVYAGSGFHGQFIRVTIGDLYVKQYMYMTSLSYGWDNETPWEITDGVQLPMYTDVNMSLSWVGTSKPKAEQIPYSYGGNKIPAVYADVPNNSGNETYQGEADNSPTPAANDASLDPQSFDAEGNQPPKPTTTVNGTTQ
jgi:hypothetical protein